MSFIKKLAKRVLASRAVFSTLTLFRGLVRFPKEVVIYSKPREKFKVKMNDESDFWLHEASFIESSIYWNGLDSGWETCEIKVWAKFSPFADVAIDVGANTGIYTLIYCSLNKFGRSIAYEPVQRNYDRLVNNVNANEFSNCITKQSVVSDVVGQVSIIVPKNLDVPYSSSITNNYYKYSPTEEIVVASETIDSLKLKDHKLIIKIDVEGAEFLVINGLLETISNNDTAILIEISFSDDSNVEKFENIFSLDRFHIFRVDRKVVPIHDIKSLIGVSHLNILILCKESYFYTLI